MITNVIDTPQEMKDAFAALLEKSFETELKAGTIVVGEIIRVEKDGLIVDIGGKSEGFVPVREIMDCRTSDDLKEQFEAGQVKEFYIVSDVDRVDQEIHYNLSLRRVTMWKNWYELTNMKENNETVTVTVTGVTKGGVIVSVMSFKGFIPASQLRVAKTLDELVGEELPAKILEVDKKKNKLILSHREAVFAQKAAQRAETMKTMNEGDVVTGKVVKITDFGAFVDIAGIDGLLPLSEITWRRIQNPGEVLDLGQEVSVRVLTVDRELQRISLSLKRMENDPWDTVSERYEEGMMITGPITKMLGSGVLVEMEPGVEAYCSYSTANRRFYQGETHEFEVVSVLADDRRITLEYRSTPEGVNEAPSGSESKEEEELVEA